LAPLKSFWRRCWLCFSFSRLFAPTRSFKRTFAIATAIEATLFVSVSFMVLPVAVSVDF
jgi:hypothetical protein